MITPLPTTEPVGLLLSYWYFQRADVDAIVARTVPEPWSAKVFADSGGFTAHTRGAEVTVEGYAAWINRWAHRLDVVATLDVIGDAPATRANTERLRDLVDVAVIPAFHVNEPFAELARYIEDGERYIALGGMVGKPMRALISWCTAAHRLAEGRCVFHGFGLTGLDALRALPWYSADSSSWSMPRRHGHLTLYDEYRDRLCKLRVVNQGPQRATMPLRAAREVWADVHRPDVTALAQRWRFDPTCFLDPMHFERGANIYAALGTQHGRLIEAAMRDRHGEVRVPDDGDVGSGSGAPPPGLHYYHALDAGADYRMVPWCRAHLDHPAYPGPSPLDLYYRPTATQGATP